MRLDAEDDAEAEEEETGLETTKNAPPVQPPPGVVDDAEVETLVEASTSGFQDDGQRLFPYQVSVEDMLIEPAWPGASKHWRGT